MQLHIKVVEGKDFPKTDVFGKCDPFCVLQVNSHGATYKTKVEKKTFTPYWTEEFHIPIQNPTTDVLNISVFDEDKGSTNDLVSKLDLAMRDIVPATVKDSWYPLTPAEGMPKGGQIRLCTHLALAGEIPFKPAN